MEDLLVPGEELVREIVTDNRTIYVTNRRLVLVEESGGYSTILLSAVVATEVSDAGDGGKFAKVHFGGGLSRTVKVRSAADAAALAGAFTR